MRKTISFVLRLAAAAIALPQVAGAQATSEPACPKPETQARVIIEDFSGSMWRSDGMRGKGDIRRFSAAQSVATNISRQYLAAPQAPPLGLVIFGNRFAPTENMCREDVTRAVPVQASGEALQHIVDVVTHTRPKGKTPLFDAMLAGAEALRQYGGGDMIVITDYDEETCGPDPCTIEHALREIGLPLGEKIRIAYVVSIGLNAQNRRNVRRFAVCTGAREIFVDDLPGANAAAQIVACDKPVPAEAETAVVVQTPVPSAAPPARPAPGNLEAAVQHGAATLFEPPASVLVPLFTATNQEGQTVTISGATSLLNGNYTVSYDGALKLEVPRVSVVSGATTRLTIVDAPGRLRIEARYRGLVRDPAVEWLIERTDDPASTTIRLLGPTLDQSVPPGNYRITAKTREGRSLSLSKTVEAGQMTTEDDFFLD